MRYALIALLLSGCGTWSHPSKTDADFEADLYTCERDAAAVGDAFRALEMKRRCMRLKGWTEG